MDWDWTKIKTEYITTDKSSYRKLSEKYDIPLGTIYKRAKKENWVDLKQQSYDKRVAKTISAVEDKQVGKLERILNITDKLLDKIERLEAPESEERAIRLRFTSSIASGNEVLTVKNLAMSFGQKKLFEDLNFLVKKNDRLLIIGPNGCGKSTLIKILMKTLTPLTGKVEDGYNVEVGYYDQENQNLDPNKTVIDELWDHYPTLPEQKIRSTLAWFNFFGEDVFKTVKMLSGGERARLTLSKLILSHMNLLILDEPTNHLDIDSREALESALEEFDGTIIAVSHDRYFIEKLASRIIELKPDGYVDGDMFDYQILHTGEAYTEFRRFTNERKERLAATSTATETAKAESGSQKEQYLRNKQNAAEERKRTARIRKLNSEMEKLESEIEEIDAEMNGSAATDYKKVAELDARKTEAEERLLEIMEELEELE